MKTIIYLYAALCLQLTYAHSDLLSPVSQAQSSSSLEWKNLETQHTRILYPDYLEERALHIANLIEHYSKVVGLSFGNQSPKKFPLVLRPESAELNGFVTLQPRRSEWYTSATLNPVIGALNFDQALAIHEYRHVIQYDYMNRSTNKFAYFIFGEYGLALALGLGLPAWFFEGDAVWAETQYTDAGRGRSPRFSARLKALVLNDALPGYDTLLGGSLKNDYPNHYVFGYYLVTAARNRFGDDFWAKVLNRTADFSFHPYAMTNDFARISGMRFEDFYNDVVKELKDNFKDERFKKDSREYVAHYFPIVDEGKLYYLQRTLDTRIGLYRYGQSKPIEELALIPDLTRADLKNGNLVYTQFLPSARYHFKSFSDLFLYNINKESFTQLTSGKRIFNPQFSPNGQFISAIEQNDKSQFSLVIFDLSGDIKQRFALKNDIINEATWINQSTLALIIQKESSDKTIATYDFQSKKLNQLSLKTKNNLTSLRASGDRLYFEADWEGTVQILSLSRELNDLKICTDEVIAAYQPYVHEAKLYYVAEVARGRDLKAVPLQCRSVAISKLENYQYLAESASDGYQYAKPIELKLSSKTYQTRELNEFSAGLKPHSWSFVSGRGYDLSLTGHNLLGTFSYSLGVGQSAEERKPFAYAQLHYAKYYPILSLTADYRERRDEILGAKSEWEETEYEGLITLPYTFKKGLYLNHLELVVGAGMIEATRNRFATSYEISDEKLTTYDIELSYINQKDLTAREIYPEYGLQSINYYKEATADKNKNFSSYTFFSSLNVYLPAFAANDGFKLHGATQLQKKGSRNYRFEPVRLDAAGYVFSRGFKYGYVDDYKKASLEYAAPLLTTDFELGGWAYLRRISTRLFYDHTKIEVLGFNDHFNSVGTELLFESYVLRKFPFDIGNRYSHKIDGEGIYDFFLRMNLSY